MALRLRHLFHMLALCDDVDLDTEIYVKDRDGEFQPLYLTNKYEKDFGFVLGEVGHEED